MKDTMRWMRFIVLISPFLLICQGSVILAQSSGSGEIRGTVTDKTGALISGVKVMVVNVDTGVTKTYTSDSAGLYDTSPIVIGNYKLTFSKEGFNQLVRGPVSVLVGYTTVNATLPVGSVNQKVTVNTDVPLLKTESQEMSTTLEAKDLSQLPETGQDWENFTILVPGVTGTASGGTAANPSQFGSANGNLPYANISLNGSSIAMVNSSSGPASVLETVAELQVVTSDFSAQYGIGGIQYNQISKGGTSQFHGAAYEYWQNSGLNAASYGFGNKIPVNYLRYNNYGFSIGGPILKKKMFFYFNYDKTDNNTGANSGYATLPTAAVLSGDFTGFPTIYDPTTQVVTPTGTVTQPDGTIQKCPCVTRKSFAAEYGNGNKIPLALQSQVARNIAAYYPTPAHHPSTGKFVPGTFQPSSGIFQNNYYYSIPESNPITKYFGRLDYDFSPTNRLTVSDVEQNNPSVGLSFFGCPIACQTIDIESNLAQISDVWNISPHTINEARYGFDAGLVFFEDATFDKNYPQKIGLQFAKANVFPTINILGYNGFSPGTNAILKQFTYDPSDVFTMIRGKHVLRFGGEFLMYINNATTWGNLNSSTMNFGGNDTYTQQYAGDTATGSSYADFLIGDAGYWGASVSPEFGGRYKTPQFFVQDDYKVMPNLTLNLGVRYEIQHGWNEVHQNMESFDPTILNPATGTLGAMWFGTTHTNGRRSLQATVWSDVLPRLGFAWAPKPTTTIRGGFGMYVYNYTIGRNGYFALGGETSYGGNALDLNGINPVVNLSSSGANLPFIGPDTNPAALNGQSVIYAQYHEPDTKIMQWNLAIQRAFGSSMVGQVAYVASHAYNLPFAVDINQIPLGKISPTDSNADRPYPQYQQIGGQSGYNNAMSNYNSLQASITKRLTSGFSLDFNYTWSHFLNEADTSANQGGNEGSFNYQNSYDPKANYGNSNFDVRSAFKGYAVYQLPIGLGRKFLNTNRILDAVIGGWQATGTIVEQTGNPFTVLVNANNYAGSGSLYPNRIGNPHLSHPNIHQWFNPAAYAYPLIGTFGTERRNSLYGPGLNEVNLSAGKTFALWRTMQLLIRADATNAFNHPSFGNPNSGLTCTAPGAPCSANNVTEINSTTVGGRTMQLGAHLEF